MRAALALATLIFSMPVQARDLGQWSQADPKLRSWYNSLRQPDNPAVSCCGEADAVEADQWRALPNGDIEATVTNGRGYVPDGTVIIVPKNKVNYEPNPTGHAILFLSPKHAVYCFVLGTGI